MWIATFAVTIAMAIGFTVAAIVIEFREESAPLVR